MSKVGFWFNVLLRDYVYLLISYLLPNSPKIYSQKIENWESIMAFNRWFPFHKCDYVYLIITYLLPNSPKIYPQKIENWESIMASNRWFPFQIVTFVWFFFLIQNSKWSSNTPNKLNLKFCFWDTLSQASFDTNMGIDCWICSI